MRINGRVAWVWVGIALVVGGAVFVGPRWTGWLDTYDAWPPSHEITTWLLVPIICGYVASAAACIYMVRVGAARWWWLPGVTSVVFMESWLASPYIMLESEPLLALRLGVDLVAVLLPAAVAMLATRPARVRLSGRAVPAAAAASASLVFAMLVDAEGPSVSLAVMATLLVMGACTPRMSWGRGAVFLGVALGLNGMLPYWISSTLDMGFSYVRPIDIGVDLVVAAIAASIPVVAVRWDVVLERRSVPSPA